MTTKPNDASLKPPSQELRGAATQAAEAIGDLVNAGGNKDAVAMTLAYLVTVALGEQHAAGQGDDSLWRECARCGAYFPAASRCSNHDSPSVDVSRAEAAAEAKPECHHHRLTKDCHECHPVASPKKTDWERVQSGEPWSKPFHHDGAERLAAGEPHKKHCPQYVAPVAEPPSPVAGEPPDPEPAPTNERVQAAIAAWEGLTPAEAVAVWYEVDAMTHGDTVAHFRSQLTTAQSALEQANAQLCTWQDTDVVKLELALREANARVEEVEAERKYWEEQAERWQKSSNRNHDDCLKAESALKSHQREIAHALGLEYAADTVCEPADWPTLEDGARSLVKTHHSLVDEFMGRGSALTEANARIAELEQRLARVAEKAHDRNDDTHEKRSRRLGDCAALAWDHMEETFSKDPLKRRSTLKWASLAKQLADSEERAAEANARAERLDAVLATLEFVYSAPGTNAHDVVTAYEDHVRPIMRLVPSQSPKQQRAIPGTMWFYAESSDAESWQGPHDSLDDALEAARSDYTGSLDSFWVDEAHPVDWDKVLRGFVDADDLLERFGEYADDNERIEDPEPEFKTNKAAAQGALEAWAVTHLSMRDYWQCVGKAVVYPVSPPATPEPVTGEKP